MCVRHGTRYAATNTLATQEMVAHSAAATGSNDDDEFDHDFDAGDETSASTLSAAEIAARATARRKEEAAKLEQQRAAILTELQQTPAPAPATTEAEHDAAVATPMSALKQVQAGLRCVHSCKFRIYHPGVQ